MSESIKDKVKLEFRWHGIKNLSASDGFRTLPVADLYIDCRGVAEKGIAGWSGKSPEFQAAIRKQSPVSLFAFEDIIIDALRTVEARRSDKKDPFEKPFVVMFLCAHGVHRSVSSCHVVAERLKAEGYNVTIVESKLPSQAIVASINSKRDIGTGPKE